METPIIVLLVLALTFLLTLVVLVVWSIYDDTRQDKRLEEILSHYDKEILKYKLLRGENNVKED